MSDISEAKRILLERYLRGELTRTVKDADVISQRHQEKPVSLPAEETVSPVVPVAPLRVNGSKRPFFYLHPHAQGGAFYCFTLAHHLGPDLPFYVLDPCRFERLSTPLLLETIAAAYVEAIRAVQSEGPYFLGGFCGGAIIAFEVAQQLRAAGQAVDFLFLVEAKVGPAPHRMHARRLLGHFIRRVGSLLRLDEDRQYDWYIRLELTYIYLCHIYDYLRIHYRRLQNTLGLGSVKHSELGRIGDKVGVTFPRPNSIGIMGKYVEPHSEEWISKLVWALSRYVTCKYPGKVTYLWASQTLEQERRHTRRAKDDRAAEAEEVETHIIAGDHASIRNEHIHDFAERLRVCLNVAHEAALSQRK